MIPQPAQPSARPPVQSDNPDKITSQDLQAWIASRGRTRARIKKLCLTVLVVGVSSIALLWAYFSKQILTISHVRSIGFVVDWELNKDNFWTGGTTSVSMPFRRGAVLPIARQDLESISALPHVLNLDLSSVGSLSDDDLAFVSKLEDLTQLGLEKTRIPGANTVGTQPFNGLTDRALKHIRGLKKLVSLGLKNNRITDAGLTNIEGLQSLIDLDLSNNPITDAGLKKLANLQSLETLDLEGTQVTAEGLEALKGLKKLRFIRVEKTAITPESAVSFQAARPDVLIDRDAPLDPRGH
jgi:Leucine-rich repeat (LRR) protein